MSRQRLIKQLQSQVGARIQDAFVEFVADDSDERRYLICVSVQLYEGPAFVFVCAGDGGLTIRKGPLQRSAGTLEIKPLDQLSGSTLASVEFRRDRLVLLTAGHRIEVVNNDDDLELTVNGVDAEHLLA